MAALVLSLAFGVYTLLVLAAASRDSSGTGTTVGSNSTLTVAAVMLALAIAQIGLALLLLRGSGVARALFVVASLVEVAVRLVAHDSIWFIAVAVKAVLILCLFLPAANRFFAAPRGREA